MAMVNPNSNSNTHKQAQVQNNQRQAGSQGDRNAQVIARSARSTGVQVLEHLEQFAVSEVKKAIGQGQPLGIVINPLPTVLTNLKFNGISFTKGSSTFVVLYEHERYVHESALDARNGISVPTIGSLNVFDDMFYESIRAVLGVNGVAPKVIGHFLLTRDKVVSDGWASLLFSKVEEALNVAEGAAQGMTSANIPNQGRQLLTPHFAAVADGTDITGMPDSSSFSIAAALSISKPRERAGQTFSINGTGGNQTLLTVSGDVTLAPIEGEKRDPYQWYPIITIGQVKGVTFADGVETYLLGAFAAFSALMAGGGEQWLLAFNRGKDYDKLAEFGATNVLSGMNGEGRNEAFAQPYALNNSNEMFDLAGWVLTRSAAVELALDLNIGGENSAPALIIRDALFAATADDSEENVDAKTAGGKELADAITRLTGGALVYDPDAFFSGYEVYPIGTVQTNKGPKDLRTVFSTLSVFEYASVANAPEAITEWLCACNANLTPEQSMEAKMRVLGKLYGTDAISMIGYGHRVFVDPEFIKHFLAAAKHRGWNPELAGGYSTPMVANKRVGGIATKRDLYRGAVETRVPGSNRSGTPIQGGRRFRR